jgi:serine/threonine protein kinase
VDWWALGNLIFEMVAGFPPFFVQHERFETIKQKICNEEPPLYFIGNPLLKDLLGRLLCKDPKGRLGAGGAAEIRAHGWFFGTNWEGLLQEQVVPPFTPEIKGEADTHWFESEERELTPPDDSNASEKSGERYQEFSLSWKSSKSLEKGSHEAISPPEMIINIKEMGSK